MGSEIPIPSRHGQVVRRCTVPGTVAFTFNGGPSFYTDFILSQLAQHNARATFFLSDFAQLAEDTQSEYWDAVVQRIYDGGHLVGLHVPSPDLPARQLQKASQRLSAILSPRSSPASIQPRYIRTSPDTCTVQNGCVERLTVNGGRLVFWSLDADDLHRNSTADFDATWSARLSQELTRSDVSRDSFLIRMHDTEEQTALNIGDVLQRFSNRGFRATTVGGCIGDAEEHWYRLPEDDDVFSLLARDRPVQAPKTEFSAQPWWVGFVVVACLEVAALSCLLWAARKYKKIKSHLKIVQ